MPEPEKKRPALIEGGAAAAGMCVFALFIRAGMPLVFLSFLGLASAALAVYASFRREASRAAVLGIARPSRLLVILKLVGCVIGLVFGVFYRWQCDRDLLPGAVRWFAALAALIGGTEEVVYRGYIQGRVRRLGAVPAVVLTALSHTAYKCALFMLPASLVEIDLVFLATWTFLGGLVLGVLRELSGSVAPPLAAHACFDLVVYGELARAPWWVW